MSSPSQRAIFFYIWVSYIIFYRTSTVSVEGIEEPPNVALIRVQVNLFLAKIGGVID